MKAKITELRSEGNVRTDLGDLTELAASIKAVGVIQPLVVKKNGKGYVLLAGHRRLAAAKLAGVSEVPVHVIELEESDHEGLQLAENLHRKDLSPFDVAQTIGKELARRGFRLDHDAVVPAGLDEMAEEIALKTGAKKSYVKAMARLVFLPAFFKDMLSKDNLTVAQALMVLSLPPAAQQNLQDKFYWRGISKPGDHVSTSDLQRFIDRSYGKPLAKAPFPLDEPVGDKAPCLTCSYNTNNTDELFPGSTEKGGACRLASCWRSKCQTISTELKAEFQKKNKDMKFIGYASPRAPHYSGDTLREIKGFSIVTKAQGNAFGVVRGAEGSAPRIVYLATRPVKGGPVRQEDSPLDWIMRDVWRKIEAELVEKPLIENAKKLKAKKIEDLALLVVNALNATNSVKLLGIGQAKGKAWSLGRVNEGDLTRIVVLSQAFQQDSEAMAMLGVDLDKIKEDIEAKIKKVKKELEATGFKPRYRYDSWPEPVIKALAEHLITGKPFKAEPLPAASAKSAMDIAQEEQEAEDNRGDMDDEQ